MRPASPRPPLMDAPYLTAQDIARSTAHPLRSIQARCALWAERGWPRCEQVSRGPVGGREWRVNLADFERFKRGEGPPVD